MLDNVKQALKLPKCLLKYLGYIYIIVKTHTNITKYSICVYTKDA